MVTRDTGERLTGLGVLDLIEVNGLVIELDNNRKCYVLDHGAFKEISSQKAGPVGDFWPTSAPFAN